MDWTVYAREAYRTEPPPTRGGRLHTGDAEVALADTRVALSNLVAALVPNPTTTAARLDALKRDAAKAAGQKTTVEEIQAQAVERLERELAQDALAKGDAAENALRLAQHTVQAEVRAIEAVPSFLPERAHGASDAAHEVAQLRAELLLRDARDEWRHADVPALVNAYNAAHDAGNWLLAEALHRELQRRLHAEPGDAGLGVGADQVTGNRARITEALDAARRRRAAAVDAATRTTVDGHVSQLAHLNAEFGKRKLLLYELRQLQRMPMRGFSR